MNNIRSIEDLQKDVNELKRRKDQYQRERTVLSQDINSIQKQIEKLEGQILNNNQHELL